MLAAKRQNPEPGLVDRFHDAMRRTAAGVAVVTTQGPAGRGGITVSSFCSLSLEPPSVLVCIRRDSTTLARIVRNDVFAANVLAEDQSELASAFASPATPHDSRFAMGDWSEGPSGPTLAGAVAHARLTGSSFALSGETEQRSAVLALTVETMVVTAASDPETRV